MVGMRREVEPTNEVIGATLGFGSVNAPKTGDEFQIFERRELVVDHRLVGNPRHDRFGSDRIRQGVDAKHGNRPCIRAQQAGQHAQGRRLAGAIWAEQAIELAGAYRKIKAIDSRTIKVLAKAGQFDGWPDYGRFAHKERLAKVGCNPLN